MKLLLALVVGALFFVNKGSCDQMNDIRRIQALDSEDDALSCLIVEVENYDLFPNFFHDNVAPTRRCVFLDDGFDSTFAIENVGDFWTLTKMDNPKLGSATHNLVFPASDVDLLPPQANGNRGGATLRFKKITNLKLLSRDKVNNAGNGRKCDREFEDDTRRYLQNRGNNRGNSRGNNQGKNRGNNRNQGNGNNRNQGNGNNRNQGDGDANENEDDIESEENDGDTMPGCRKGQNIGKPNNDDGNDAEDVEEDGFESNDEEDGIWSSSNGIGWGSGGVSGNRINRNGNSIRGGRLNNRDGNNRKKRERGLVQLQGTSSVLVVRITDQVNDAPTKSASEISIDVFFDQHNLASRFNECSGGKLTMVPATGSNIINGVAEVTVPYTVAGQSAYTVESWAVTAATNALGNLGQWTHVMIVLPGSVDFGSGVAAYAYLNWYLSVFKDTHSSNLQVQVHEFGHNLYHGHSGEGNQNYGDGSCMMGASIWNDDAPVMCFNGPKSWYMGWYSDRHVSIDPSAAAFDGKMVGINDYLNGEIPLTSTDHHVIAMVGTDLYIMYNRKEGVNGGVVEKGDLVTVVQQELPFNRQSWIRAGIDAGGVWRSANWNGGSFDLVVKVCAKVSGTPDYARILVYLENFNTLSCITTPPPTPPPTAPPTAPPTLPPTAPPTFPPTTPPTPPPTTINPGTPNPTPPPTLPPTSPPTTPPTSPPGCPQVQAYLQIKFDRYPLEVGWKVTDDATGMIVKSVPSGTYGWRYMGRQIRESFMLINGNSYTFEMLDSYGDGICCSYGYGYYKLEVDGLVVATGGQYGTSNSHSLVLPCNPPTKTDVTVVIKFDKYPDEIGWSIVKNSDSSTVKSVSTGTYSRPRYKRRRTREKVTVERGVSYRFTIVDTYGDGLCCRYRRGWYRVIDDRGNTLAYGDVFAYIEETNFIVA